MLVSAENINPVENALVHRSEKQAVRKNVQGLDFLRAAAALSVCLYHFSGAALPKVINIYMKPTFSYGWAGVDMFFVISGFIIPYSLMGKGYSLRHMGSYMLKRIIRINPPAYVAMFLVLLQWAIIDYVINHNLVYTGDISLPQLMHNLLFTVPFTNYKWVIGIFWTLAIEFQFYLFIGLFFSFLFESDKLWKFIVSFLIVNALQYLPFNDFRNFFHFSALFAMGGITLLYYYGRIKLLNYLLVLALFTALSYVQLGMVITAVGLITVFFIVCVQVKGAFFSLIGKMSYSFYLIHVLIGTTAEFVLIRIIHPDTELRKVVITILCIVVALVAAYIYYLLIEQPFMRLAKKYGK